jgi:hypothetical protein
MSNNYSNTSLLEKIQFLEKTIADLQMKLSEMENLHKCPVCNQIAKYMVQNHCKEIAPKYKSGRYKCWTKPDIAYCTNKVFSCQTCNNSYCIDNNHKFHKSALEPD